MTEWLKSGNTAVITGGANGIGLAAAERYMSRGMNVVIADTNAEALDAISLEGDGKLIKIVCDVTSLEQVEALKSRTLDEFGRIDCLMNNAGAAVTRAKPWEDIDGWKKQLDINLWGVIHGCQAFLPAMLEAGEAAAVINTGSKQGITNPPGNYAYNLSKAGVKAYTESVAHALRQLDGCPVSAHLLIPGFTYTGMIARFFKEQPPGAWSPDQVVDFLLDALARGDFYVLCPDNETPRALDEKRIQWNTDDLLRSRSALSRWDPAYEAAYQAFVDD